MTRADSRLHAACGETRCGSLPLVCMIPHPYLGGKESRMHLFDEAIRAMEEISQEADFFAKARKKRRQISQGDYTFAGDR